VRMFDANWGEDVGIVFFLFFFGFLAKVEKNQVIIVCCVRPMVFNMLA